MVSGVIESASNQKIKRIIQLQSKSQLRRSEKCFVVEGIKMFLEAREEQIQEVYVSQSYWEMLGRGSARDRGEAGYQIKRGSELHSSEIEVAVRNKLSKLNWEEVSSDLFRKMSDTQTPQGILSVLRQPHYELESLMGKEEPTFLVVLEDLQDPGNLGTIIRTAEGAGASGIIMSRGTVDLFNPKTIRSTMGAIYRMPFLYADSIIEMVTELKNRGISVYAAHLKGCENYDQKDYRKECAFLIGNEARGLSDQLTELADEYVRIPMKGQVESLNASVAAALIMYEAARQRR